MKKIEAIIRKTKFEEVKDALLEADIEWFSYYDVRGIGKSRQARIYRGVLNDKSYIARILISIDARAPHVAQFVFVFIFVSSFPSKTPFASAQENGVTSPSTMPNRKDKRQHSNHTNFIGRRAR